MSAKPFDKLESEEPANISDNQIYSTKRRAAFFNAALTLLIIVYSLISGVLSHQHKYHHLFSAETCNKVYLALAACYLSWEWLSLFNLCALNQCKEWQFKSCFLCFWTVLLLIFDVVIFSLIGGAEAEITDFVFNYIPYGLIMLNGFMMIQRLVEFSSNPLILAQYQNMQATLSTEDNETGFSVQLTKSIPEKHHNAVSKEKILEEFSAYDFLDE